MKKTETVLDLLLFIDEEIKAGRINYETPVSFLHGGYLRSVELSIGNASKKKPRKVVSRGGDVNLIIE